MNNGSKKYRIRLVVQEYDAHGKTLYSCICPDITQIFVSGETHEEAIKIYMENLQYHLNERQKFNDPMPDGILAVPEPDNNKVFDGVYPFSLLSGNNEITLNGSGFNHGLA